VKYPEMPPISVSRLLPAKVWKDISDCLYNKPDNRPLLSAISKNPYLLDNLNTLIRRNAELGLYRIAINTEYLGIKPEEISIVQDYIISLGYDCLVVTSMLHGHLLEISWS